MNDPQKPKLLLGQFVGGKIAIELDGVGGSWTQVLNDAGGISGVVVPEDVVRRFNLRQNAVEWLHYLALEQDGRIKQAGPITGRSYDWKTGQLTLNAGDIWTYFDHRKIVPYGMAPTPMNLVNLTLGPYDLSGIVIELVNNAYACSYGSFPPMRAPASLPGSRTWVFDGWQSIWLGTQLRQITQQYVQAPNPNPSSGFTEPTIAGIDIAFTPRRKPEDKTIIEWVVGTGTEAAPKMVQTGADWLFDATAPRTPVRGISVQSDGASMGIQAYASGNGSEQSTLMGYLFNDAGQQLENAGYPLIDVEGHYPTATDYTTLTAFMTTLMSVSSRPIEVWQVDVAADQANEVLPGHYCRVITKDDPFVGTTNRRMRVQSINGNIGSDTVTLNMFSQAGTL